MTKCTFCGNDITRGTGVMYVFKEGKVNNFCSSKCKKNLLKLGRKATRLKWTKRFIKNA